MTHLISEKLAVMKLKRLSVISTLKKSCQVDSSSKFCQVRPSNWREIGLLSLDIKISILALTNESFLLIILWILSQFIKWNIRATKVITDQSVCLLSNYFKVYEKLIYNQLYQYFDNILFPNQFGFQKGYCTLHCLLVIIEKFKEAIDTGTKFRTLLTDLSKAFDCLDHSLLVVKFHWCGVSPLSRKLIFSYFRNRNHRIKIK